MASPDPHDHATRAASFSTGADTYAAVRPSYPDATVDWLLPAGARRVLDLAAGTGKLTASLVARGLDVVAVDPSGPMLSHLEAALPGVETHVATAEAIPLAEGTVDAVVVGQAWHWFDEGSASAETARVLRHGGTLGIVWNDRDTSVDWVARFGEILHRGDRLESVAAHDAPVLGPEYDGVEHTAFRWSDEIETASLRALAASRSYFILLPEAEREALLAAVDELAATHPDLAGRARVTLPYVTHAYRARRRSTTGG
ncbi:Methyltransferase type 11 [Xylanimonas cellulosilytica DSM 15894]|uniref:Methyltransferase type 11 n=1 Tax=Xylanimonas cellulosilytica (strain DSM 15894 / JCM 12276 / CECT 5975 / KCTC 9989 / LMG 20990 / NBRC 107835 / XIL07) TaxID=446471 RepID=D1BVQ8_XYLCX|nr:class I SAM-dependent methyltransferase [Xylanimonas cellulosilytica]ACZ31377.1 Methyltransferase type 11 [Xylanimonas cellulosilytica DSM 15894]